MQARAIVNKANLLHNIEFIQSLYPNSKLVFILKANAYGHGLIAVSSLIQKASPNAMFGVCEFEQALTLRAHHPHNKVLLLQGVSDQREMVESINQRLDLVIHSPDQSALLELPSQPPPYSQKINLWLKINTGMNRLGFCHKKTDFLIKTKQKIDTLKHAKLYALMSHLACADLSNDKFSLIQIDRLKQTQEKIQAPNISIANSAAVLKRLVDDGSDNHLRVGLALYGISPFTDSHPNTTEQLMPAMTLKAPVIAIHTLLKGEGVGYGLTWQAKKSQKIAIIKIGYGDGYPRSLGNKASVYFNKHFFPIVGNISMDSLAIDINTAPDAINIGDEVEMWGETISIRQLSKQCSSIPYELYTGLSSRVKNEFF